MTSCDETRDHLESCEDCRLHIIVEARLRTLPVLEPPKGLVDRAMKALPRTVPLRREFFRLAAAAVMLVGLSVTALGFGLDNSAPVVTVKTRTAHALETTSAIFNAWRAETWKQ